MVRGERLIKLRDSWFSAKSIEVERSDKKGWGRALNKLGGFSDLTELKETPNTTLFFCADGLWALRFKVERETAQIVC